MTLRPDPRPDPDGWLAAAAVLWAIVAAFIVITGLTRLGG